jgi:hypothetical protein
MNRIVREHYPAALLPSDLREGIAADARVTVVVSEETLAPSPLSFRKVFEELRDVRVETGDPVARVRALREEWDSRIRAPELDALGPE